MVLLSAWLNHLAKKLPDDHDIQDIVAMAQKYTSEQYSLIYHNRAIKAIIRKLDAKRSRAEAKENPQPKRKPKTKRPSKSRPVVAATPVSHRKTARVAPAESERGWIQCADCGISRLDSTLWCDVCGSITVK